MVLVAAAGVGPTATAHAQTPFTLTFNNTVTDVPAGINYVDNCYTESGVRVMAVGDPCGMPASLATYTSADPTGYTGSGALFSTFQPSIDLMPVNGTFSLSSIGVAPFLLGMFDTNPIAGMFLGMRGGSTVVSQNFTLGTGLTGLTTMQLNGFTNLSSFRVAVNSPSFEPYVQIDNVVGTVTATPEPATFALVGLGLVGLGAVRRRRQLVVR